MENASQPRVLARAFDAIEEASATADAQNALASGALVKTSSSDQIASLVPGRPGAQGALEGLVEAWRQAAPDFDGAALALLMRTMLEVVAMERERSPEPRLVWTGPIAPVAYPRTTRQVVKDIIAAAAEELMVIGYWLAGPSDGEGIVADVIELIAQAAIRGVEVRMALDQKPRDDGSTNMDVLRALWPSGQPLPEVYGWPDVLDEPYLKLHAKTIVGDRQDALVTSANLSMHALDRNMELGVRVGGSAACRIADHIDGLIEDGMLRLIKP